MGILKINCIVLINLALISLTQAYTELLNGRHEANITAYLLPLYNATQSSISETVVKDEFGNITANILHNPMNPIDYVVLDYSSQFDAYKDEEKDWAELEPNACSITEKDEDPFAWWSAELNTTYKVLNIEILARNVNSSSELSSVEIYVDNKRCGQFNHNGSIDGEWTTFKCEKGGITGNTITITRNSVN